MKRVCALLLVVTGAGLCQSVRTVSNPNASAIRHVCLAPPEAHLMRVGMKGGESLLRESEEWAAKLGTTFGQAITDAGGQLSADLSAGALSGDEARQIVLRIRQKYDNISPLMRKKRGDVKKGRYTLGDEISLLPCARDADSVVFIDAEGQIQTGGRKTLSILAGGLFGAFNAMSSYRVWISFLDARSGDVKALLTISALGGKIGKDPEAALRTRLVAEFKRAHIGADPVTARQ